MIKIYIAVVIIVSLFFTRPVYAYLDPGSGSMIWQMLLGALASVVVFFKFFGRKFLALFGYAKKDTNNPDKSDSKKKVD
ncbi:MAG: hypothetical protein HXY53_04920 [Nitrospirae bacterium]|nr:hypothetical protein [Nitrospirota bacterium]